MKGNGGGEGESGARLTRGGVGIEVRVLLWSTTRNARTAHTIFPCWENGRSLRGHRRSCIHRNAHAQTCTYASTLGTKRYETKAARLSAGLPAYGAVCDDAKTAEGLLQVRRPRTEAQVSNMEREGALVVSFVGAATPDIVGQTQTCVTPLSQRRQK